MVIATPRASPPSGRHGSHHPYCVNADGHGPAWGNSLFEDAAEYGYGKAMGLRHRREKVSALMKQALPRAPPAN